MEAMRALSRVKLCAAVVGWCASVADLIQPDVATSPWDFGYICFPHAID